MSVVLVARLEDADYRFWKQEVMRDFIRHKLTVRPERSDCAFDRFALVEVLSTKCPLLCVLCVCEAPSKKTCLTCVRCTPLSSLLW